MAAQLQFVPDYRQRLLDRFAQTNRELLLAAKLLPAAALQKAVLPEGFTPYATLAYLCDLDRWVFLPVYESAFAGVPLQTFPVQPGIWAALQARREQPLPDLIASLRKARCRQADIFGGISAPFWNRTARHPAWGLRTVQWWLETQVEITTHSVQQLRQAVL